METSCFWVWPGKHNYPSATLTLSLRCLLSFGLHCFALLCFALRALLCLLCCDLHCFALLGLLALLCFALHCFALLWFVLLCLACIACTALLLLALLALLCLALPANRTVTYVRDAKTRTLFHTIARALCFRVRCALFQRTHARYDCKACCLALLRFALLCSALLCFALLCFALLCLA